MSDSPSADCPQWVAGRDDAGVPTIYREDDARTQEWLLGSTMWEARREAAHRNGDHDKRRNPRCLSCITPLEASER